MATTPTLYDTLGVPPDASQDEIKAAWKRHLKYWHPDRNARSDAEPRSKAINQAFETLSDPKRRQDYDTKLSHGDTDAFIDDAETEEAWAPAWTPPPGRYRARGSRPGTRSSASGWSPPPPAWDSTAPPPVRPTSGGFTWTDVRPSSYGTARWRRSRAALVWLAKPLLHPTLNARFVWILCLRLAVIAALAAGLWLTVPLIVQAVIWVVSLLIVVAALVFFLVLLGVLSGGSKKRGRGRGRRRR